MGFGRFSPSQGETIPARDARAQFMGSLADGGSVPSEFTLCQALPALSELRDGAGHEQPSDASFECFGGLD
jgi:hypothetical protein